MPCCNFGDPKLIVVGVETLLGFGEAVDEGTGLREVAIMGGGGTEPGADVRNGFPLGTSLDDWFGVAVPSLFLHGEYFA